MIEINAASCALYAYKETEGREKYFSSWYPENKYVEIENDNYVISSDNHCAVVSIAGTDDIWDILDDIDIIFEDHAILGSVHSGFLEVFLELVHQLTIHLSPHIAAQKEIYFIGHSKGGALALMFGKYFAFVHRNSMFEIYTYGCPRVFDKESLKRLDLDNVRHHRYVLGKDPVPRRPRKIWGYKHDCKSIKIKNGWYSFLWFGDRRDHPILEYVHKIALRK